MSTSALFSDITDKHEAVKVINAALNENHSRKRGLLMLQHVLSELSASELSPHIITWFRLCIKPIITAEREEHVLKYSLTCSNLVHITGHAEAGDARFIAQNFLSQLIPKLIANTTSNHKLMKPSLDVLISCMRQFSGPCGVYQKDIRKSLLSLLDDSVPCMESVAEALALSICLGGGGNNGVTHVNNYTAMCNDLLHTTHHTLDRLYDGIPEFKVTSVPGSLLLTDIGSNLSSGDLVSALHTRVKHLLVCLQAMLISGVSVTVSVPVVDLVELISRILSINPIVANNKSLLDRNRIAHVIPHILLTTLQLIHPTILCCGGNLLPYSSRMIKMLLVPLQWSTAPPTNTLLHSLYRCVRGGVYSAVRLWVHTMGAGSLYMESLSTDLINHILNDITPKLPTNKPTSSENLKLSKKQKRAALITEAGQLTRSRDVATSGTHTDTCTAALQCLNTILCTHTLPTNKYKECMDIVVSISVSVSSSVLQQPPPPYTSAVCRAALLECIQSTLLYPHDQLLPLHYIANCIPTLTRPVGLGGLAGACATLLHPRYPPLPSQRHTTHVTREVEPTAPTDTDTLHCTEVEQEPSTQELEAGTQMEVESNGDGLDHAPEDSNGLAPENKNDVEAACENNNECSDEESRVEEVVSGIKRALNTDQHRQSKKHHVEAVVEDNVDAMLAEFVDAPPDAVD